MEETFEATQNKVKRMFECISKLLEPNLEKSLVEKCISLLKEWLQRTFLSKVKEKRLFSDLYKNITKCEITYE